MAQSRPAKLAVVDRGGRSRHDWRQLDDDVTRLAAWMAGRGVRGGDVVSIQLPNCYEFVVAAVATQRLGAVINPLLPIYRRKELLHVLTVARPKVICTPASYRGHDHLGDTARIIGDAGQKVMHVVVDDERPAAVDPVDGPTVWFADALESAPVLPAGAREEEAGAVSELIFTSGTEASPKAIMHTEQTANFSVRTAHRALGMGADEVVWMPSPIGHSTGFNYGVRFAVFHGLPLVLQDRWDPKAAFDLVAAEGGSYTLASTTFLQDLVVEAERRRAGLGSMARFGCGGAPVPPDSGAAGSSRRYRCSPALRLHRGAGGHLEPARQSLHQAASTPMGWRCPMWRWRSATIGTRLALRAPPERLPSAVPTPASACSQIRNVRRPPSTTMVGCGPAISPSWTVTVT